MGDPGATAIATAIADSQGPALCAYLTAGYPSLDIFPEVLDAVADEADLIEIGVPFSDPMADGLTIQKSSRIALEKGVTLHWILDYLGSRKTGGPPLLLMGYYNPFLTFGLGRLADALVASGVSGLIVPDLPHEENAPLYDELVTRGLALVPLVTPTTPPPRLRTIFARAAGFTYAVTTTGVTGGETALGSEVTGYLDRVRTSSPLPVLAGFGLRTNEQVRLLEPHADGVVVGSALIETLDSGLDVGAFLRSLRPLEVPS